MESFFKKSISFGAFLVIIYASYLLVLLSLPYIYFEKHVGFLETKQLIYHNKIWLTSFYIHVFTSPIVIISGLFQFNKRILKKKPKIHRLLGKIYIFTVLFVTGPAAFVMSLYANGGRVTQTSFVILSTLWILFTFLAYQKIRNKEIKPHVRWMIRSYALTLSAVTLRFYAYLLDVFNVDIPPREAYLILAYISWIPNLIVAEIYIRSRWFFDFIGRN
ncbi:MAG: DUF2306 domain-containing protein [Fluviicola sp.]|nr:DUF2306 domain-containing protein [Fluviicola sp.]